MTIYFYRLQTIYSIITGSSYPLIPYPSRAPPSSLSSGFLKSVSLGSYGLYLAILMLEWHLPLSRHLLCNYMHLSQSAPYTALSTEPDSPFPALQGEESSEREVRPHTSLPPPVSCPVCPWPNPLPTHLFNPWSANQPQVHILYFLVWYYGHSPDVCLTHNTTTWWVANTSQGPVACISTPHSVMTRR